MKRIILFLITATTFINILAAQDTHPVQFVFEAVRVNDSVAYLSVKAKPATGTAIFSTVKKGSDTLFYSSIKLTGRSIRFQRETDTITELGKLRLIIEKGNGATQRLYNDSVEFRLPLHVDKDSVWIKGVVQWLGKGKEDYPSGEEEISVKLNAAANKEAATPTDKDDLAHKSIWTIFLYSLGLGFAAIFTPCVFPLIPVTVSVFLKRNKTKAAGVRNALLYSLSIIFIYVIPTLVLTLIFGDKILYNLSVHPVTNLLFFAFFLVFAISLLGAFELQLPHKWANKADEQSGKGGIAGIFFMALTLAIVSFSCTGPLVGGLLGQTSSQGIGLAPVVGMLGFGLGLALPFSLFAFFPSLLQGLPKSGGWLNSVKVVFGFIELALALKFLSNVDLIYHWRLLDRDVFLVLWIIIFFLAGLYLLGKLKFSHDSDLKYISVPRLFFAIISLSFALYLVPGLWGAPLKPLSGFIPPATTQDFNLEELKYTIGSNNVQSTNTSAAQPPKKYTDKLHVPFGLTAYFDLEEGMAAAKALNKPVMLDFTGHSCANCRRMEESVWKQPEVLKRIKENFVLVSLYVDESTELPEEEQYIAKDGKKIKTVGDKNLQYETDKFGLNAQPLYMFLDLNGNPLSNIKYGYDPDVNKFVQHLDAVKITFEQIK